MKQSVLTSISKKIGISQKKINFPSKEEVQELQKKVLEKDLEAFEKIYTYYRFLESTNTFEQYEIMGLITETFRIGQAIWKDTYLD